MAKNKVILTAGECIKREGRLMSGNSAPGLFVMPAENADRNELTDKSTAAFAPTTAGYVRQIAIADLSSLNGMDWNDTYVAGDQIPVLYPTNGCIVNVRCAATSAIAMGANVAVDATGAIVAATGEEDAIGIANENWDPADYPEGEIKKIKVEVLK